MKHIETETLGYLQITTLKELQNQISDILSRRYIDKNNIDKIYLQYDEFDNEIQVYIYKEN